MAGNIKGITIEFKAKYTDLDRAISKINKETTKLDRELKKVDKALKFNPGSVQLWSQKQQILTQKITETENKLKKLREQQQILKDSGLDETSEEYRKVQREIVECESKLKTFKKQLIQVGNVKLKALGEQLKQIGSKMTEVGKNLSAKVTAPIVAGFAAATKASLTFGDAMAKVSTIADTSEVPLDTLKKNILDLSNQSGKGASELAEATYQALSASVATKDVSSFLTQAVGLAKAGFLDTAGAVDVLTTVINAYGTSASEADKIANMLIQTQNDGKTTVNELAQAMGQVIPTAAALNIPLEQLSAGYVALTKQGINTANATTYLNGMFNELAKDGSTVSQILQQQTGKTFGQLMADGKTLGDVMQILNESVNGNSEAFLNLWGNTRAGKGALALLNNGVDEFNTEVDKMLNSTGNVEEALNNLSTPGAKARKALNSVVNAGIQIGDVLAPYIEKAAEWVQKLADKFSSLSPRTQKLIVIIAGIVAAIGPLLVIFGTLATAIGSIISLFGMIAGVGAAVFAPIIAGIVGAIAMGVLLYKHWDQIKAFASALGDHLKAVWETIKATVVSVWTAIQTFLTTVWNGIKLVIQLALQAIYMLTIGRFQMMLTMVKTIFNAIKTAITTVWNAIQTATANTWNSIKSTATTTWNAIKSAITRPIQSAYDKVKSIIQSIKKLFPISIGKIFSNLKLPHFSLNMSSKSFGKLGTISYPTGMSVNWYAKGGIFDNPSLIGVGEAGSEAVVPLDRFWEEIRNSNATTDDLLAQQTRLLLAMYEEMQKEKNFKVDGIWAGRYVNSLVR